MEKSAGAVPTIAAAVAFKKFKYQVCTSPTKPNKRNQVYIALISRGAPKTGGVSGMLGVFKSTKRHFYFPN